MQQTPGDGASHRERRRLVAKHHAPVLGRRIHGEIADVGLGNGNVGVHKAFKQPGHMQRTNKHGAGTGVLSRQTQRTQQGCWGIEAHPTSRHGAYTVGACMRACRCTSAAVSASVPAVGTQFMRPLTLSRERVGTSTTLHEGDRAEIATQKQQHCLSAGGGACVATGHCCQSAPPPPPVPALRVSGSRRCARRCARNSPRRAHLFSTATVIVALRPNKASMTPQDSMPNSITPLRLCRSDRWPLGAKGTGSAATTRVPIDNNAARVKSAHTPRFPRDPPVRRQPGAHKTSQRRNDTTPNVGRTTATTTRSFQRRTPQSRSPRLCSPLLDCIRTAEGDGGRTARGHTGEGGPRARGMRRVCVWGGGGGRGGGTGVRKKVCRPATGGGSAASFGDRRQSAPQVAGQILLWDSSLEVRRRCSLPRRHKRGGRHTRASRAGELRTAHSAGRVGHATAPRHGPVFTPHHFLTLAPYCEGLSRLTHLHNHVRKEDHDG
jgi:hypothetical protein